MGIDLLALIYCAYSICPASDHIGVSLHLMTTRFPREISALFKFRVDSTRFVGRGGLLSRIRL
jgi:hypothetical protein